MNNSSLPEELLISELQPLESSLIIEGPQARNTDSPVIHSIYISGEDLQPLKNQEKESLIIFLSQDELSEEALQELQEKAPDHIKVSVHVTQKSDKREDRLGLLVGAEMKAKVRMSIIEKSVLIELKLTGSPEKWQQIESVVIKIVDSSNEN